MAVLVLNREVLSNVMTHVYRLLEWNLKSIGELNRDINNNAIDDN